MLSVPAGVAVDASANVYVTGSVSENVFKITPQGRIKAILDATGDGLGNTLHSPAGIAVDGFGNVYVAGERSNNVFKISGSAGAAIRNGFGSNPRGFTCVTLPVISKNWRTRVDIATPGADASVLLLFLGGALTGQAGSLGELLCAPPALPGHMAAGVHSIAIPNDPSLIGLDFCTQSATIRLSPPEVQLQNAIDIKVGAF